MWSLFPSLLLEAQGSRLLVSARNQKAEMNHRHTADHVLEDLR